MYWTRSTGSRIGPASGVPAGTTLVRNSQMPIAQNATPPRKPICLPTIWANEPITRPPTALPTSKNIVNELTAIPVAVARPVDRECHERRVVERHADAHHRGRHP